MRASRPRRVKKEDTAAHGAGRGDRPWLEVGAGLLGRVTSAFAPSVSRRQTEIMEKAGAVSTSAADLRARVNALADRLASGLERTADRIGTETRDPRCAAARWRSRSTPSPPSTPRRTAPILMSQPRTRGRSPSRYRGRRDRCRPGRLRSRAAPGPVGGPRPARRRDACVQGMVTSKKAFEAARVKVQGDRQASGGTRSPPARPSPRSWPSGGPRIGRLPRGGRGDGHGPEPLGTLEHVRGAAAQAGPLAGELLVEELAEEHDLPGLLGGRARRSASSWPRNTVPCSRT